MPCSRRHNQVLSLFKREEASNRSASNRSLMLRITAPASSLQQLVSHFLLASDILVCKLPAQPLLTHERRHNSRCLVVELVSNLPDELLRVLGCFFQNLILFFASGIHPSIVHHRRGCEGVPRLSTRLSLSKEPFHVKEKAGLHLTYVVQDLLLWRHLRPRLPRHRILSRRTLGFGLR